MIYRAGKTERDRKSGATARRLSNRAEREEWQKSGKGISNRTFPLHTCNGKCSRTLKAKEV